MQRRFFKSDNEILLLSSVGNGWLPDLPTYAAFRDCAIRCFDVIDSETGWPMIMTIPIGRPEEPTYWHIITEDEYKDITASLRRPWIPSAAVYPVDPAEIPAFEYWMTHGRPPINPYWESLLRPILCNDAPLTLTAPPPPLRTKFPAEPDPGALFSTVGTPLPVHISSAILRQAIAEGQSCPITMTPIDAPSAFVTPCGHVFNRNAISTWLAGHRTCPQCRCLIKAG